MRKSIKYYPLAVVLQMAMANTSDDGDVVRVTSKGQATIPARLRRRFGIPTPGRVRFVEEDGKLVVKPVRSPDEMAGSLEDRLPQDARLTDELRSEREADLEDEPDPGREG
jgi:AbrB family looped-hinge helix DNA binding protein